MHFLFLFLFYFHFKRNDHFRKLIGFIKKIYYFLYIKLKLMELNFKTKCENSIFYCYMNRSYLRYLNPHYIPLSLPVNTE